MIYYQIPFHHISICLFLSHNNIFYIHLLVLEHSAVRISDTLCSLCGRSNLTLRTMNSLQSVTRKEIENGLTYRSVMERNLTELKGALESSCP